MKDKVLIIIDHRPLPKQRVNWSKGKAYTPQKTRDYEKLLADVAKMAMSNKGMKPFKVDVDLELTATFVFSVPNSWSKQKKQDALDGKINPTQSNQGDLDNLLKSCLDGFNKVVFEDDRSIIKISSQKKYGIKDQIIVLVEEVKYE